MENLIRNKRWTGKEMVLEVKRLMKLIPLINKKLYCLKKYKFSETLIRDQTRENYSFQLKAENYFKTHPFFKEDGSIKMPLFDTEETREGYAELFSEVESCLLDTLFLLERRKDHCETTSEYYREIYGIYHFELDADLKPTKDVNVWDGELITAKLWLVTEEYTVSRGENYYYITKGNYTRTTEFPRKVIKKFETQREVNYFFKPEEMFLKEKKSGKLKEKTIRYYGEDITIFPNLIYKGELIYVSNDDINPGTCFILNKKGRVAEDFQSVDDVFSILNIREEKVA